MAVPTITSISPSSGVAWGGYLVAIVGTGFQPSPTTSVSFPLTAPFEDDEATIRVTINGVECPQAYAPSDTEAYAVVPEGTFHPTDPATLLPDAMRAAYSPVDVVLENIDGNGVLIPGETVTLSGGFTYELPVLSDDAHATPMMQVIGALLYRLRREVVSKSYVSRHTDYGVAGATHIVLSNHPAIQIRVDEAPDKDYDWLDNGMRTYETSSGVYTTYRAQQTVQLLVEIIASANFETVAHRMTDAVYDMILEKPYLDVDSDSRHPEHPFTNEYPFEIVEHPQDVASYGNTNVFARRMRVAIRGVAKLSGSPIAETYLRATPILLAGRLAEA